jgi:hypothetical protein
MRIRTSRKDVFVGIRLNKSLHKLIVAADENKSAFIRRAIERYIVSLDELELETV